MEEPRTARLARARRLTATMVTLLVGAALLPDPSALAATRHSVRVTRSISAPVVLSGDAVQVSGRVTPAPRGSVVSLQRSSSGSWRTVTRTRTGAYGRYSFTAHPAVGSRRYRVYSPSDSKRRSAASSAFRLAAKSCTRLSTPTSGTAAWFSRPGVSSTSQTARNIGRLLCAAAPGSSINIAMYFIRTGERDTRAILDSLAKVARYRHVRVKIVLEGRLYAKTSGLYPSLLDLKRYATVVTCSLGCHNQRRTSSDPSIMHHKFIAMSDTKWKAARDPVVLFSSANWSQSQLANRWQSTVMQYDDMGLYNEVQAEFGALAACASSAGCASWSAQLPRLGLSPVDYAMTNDNALWYTPSEERLGSPGRGSGVNFTPVSAVDPVAAALNTFTCTPEHHTVRVAHMFVTTARWRTINALERLKTQGCDVKVIVSSTFASSQSAGITRMRHSGLTVGCTRFVHDKLIMVDAVRQRTGLADRSLWMGSQSLGGNALRRNDEAMLRLSTSLASGASARAIGTVYDAYSRHWTALSEHQRPCGGVADPELSRLANSLTADPDDTVMPQ